jgi:hypothetical protein
MMKAFPSWLNWIETGVSGILNVSHSAHPESIAAGKPGSRAMDLGEDLFH